MAKIIATDSKGQTFEYANRRARKVTFAVIASYPSAPATTFSSAVVGKRDAAFTENHETARKVAKHAIGRFKAYDVEIVRVEG